MLRWRRLPRSPTIARDAASQTIADFGSQWRRYPDNQGYYASLPLLADICEPLLPLDEIRGRTVLEIGSGTGRIVNLLLDAGAERVVAVEPSTAFAELRRNVAPRAGRVEAIQATGEAIPDHQVDIVLAIGVLHHIPDPLPVVRRACELLRPGGRFLFWVYGREGNGLYLAVVLPLRRLARWLPDALLARLADLLNALLTPYLWLCRFLPLPLRGYLLRVFGRFGWRQRSLVVFDQLNPAYARYYRRSEALELMRAAGFAQVRAHHRHGYSWTVVGTRPTGPG